MIELSLLVSPATRAAYFADYLSVASAELAWCGGGYEASHRTIGGMDFLDLAAPEDALPQLARLSFVQGLFARERDKLRPLAVEPGFLLHEDFVFGSKYRGKTSEVLTQLLLNAGLAALGGLTADKVKLLDPMCGRGTTLLWAQRYGINSRGVEQDGRALGDMRQSLKKWCKLHRQKHQLREGFTGKANKQGKGKFLEFAAESATLRVVAGDAVDVPGLLGGEKFHLLVSDLPYGVQHFTTEKTRNPLAVLAACAPGWYDSLKPGGVMVLAYNRYQPKRDQLASLFTELGMEELDFHAGHRMSESILRDILVMRKSGG